MQLTSKLNQPATSLRLGLRRFTLCRDASTLSMLFFWRFWACCFVAGARREPGYGADRLLVRSHDAAISRKDNRWLDLINHRLLKDIVIVIGVALLLAGLIRRQPRWVLVALLIGVGSLAVGVLKATSAHSCPGIWCSSAVKRSLIRCSAPCRWKAGTGVVFPVGTPQAALV